MPFIVSIIFTLFLCSIPFGLVISTLLYDIDPREHHSKNIGMSNTWRCCGALAGLATLLLDTGKAVLSLWLATALGSPYLFLIGFLCVFSHCFSIYLSGKGGKGVASAAGVILFFAPQIWCTAITTWILVRFFAKKASVASLCATCTVLIHTFLFEPWFTPCIFFIGLLVLIRHKENIDRLYKKQELNL